MILGREMKETIYNGSEKRPPTTDISDTLILDPARAD
jgi:hypothetical protein